LTLPDVEGSLDELGYAMDELGASGVILLANVEGTYLGDSRFALLLAELDRRAAVVFVHPAQLPGPPAAGIPPNIADFLLDTTRTAVSLVRADAIRRYPHIRFILSHGGGFIPFASGRLAMTMTFDSPRTVEDLTADLRSFHVDTAQAVSPASMPSILSFFGADHVLFGTDWPHASDAGVAYFTRNYAEASMAPDDRAAIDRGNALRLLRRPAASHPTTPTAANPRAIFAERDRTLTAEIVDDLDAVRARDATLTGSHRSLRKDSPTAAEGRRS
jgi:predicted TIM-barrel fold metal-dependent hydrolase